MSTLWPAALTSLAMLATCSWTARSAVKTHALRPVFSTASFVAVDVVSLCRPPDLSVPRQHLFALLALTTRLTQSAAYLDQDYVCAGFGEPNGNSLSNAPCSTGDESCRALEREHGGHLDVETSWKIKSRLVGTEEKVL